MKQILYRHIPLTALTILLMLCQTSLTNRAQAQISIASFTANPVSGCSPLNVLFTNTSSNAVSYYWDFGNGNTSTQTNPSNIYSLAGNFTVTLIATSASGTSDTLIMSNLIYVDANPAANFTTTPTVGCPNTAFIFNNTSTGSVSWLWDFGDGNTSTLQNPTHNYLNPGTYTVQLIAYSAGGCSNIFTRTNYIQVYQTPTPSISSNMQNTCNTNQMFSFNGTATGANSWYWDFGDGFTSTQQNPNHVYGAYGSYNVMLIAGNAYGCSDTIILNSYINIAPAPQPTFTANVVNGCAPLSVGFTSNVTGNISSYSWNFGDNSLTSGANPSHNYNQPGSYTVTLTVTNSTGCTASASYASYINVYPTPTVSFTISDTIGCQPFNVQFNNTSTNASSYVWNFGDGGTSTQTSPSYTYLNGGTYSVTLTAISAGGCSASFVDNSAITVTSPVPVFNGYPRAGCAPLTVNFNNASYGGNNLTYLWYFGDGNSSTATNPSHTYNASGNYNVTLIVTDSLGCSDTLMRPNYVQVSNPNASFVPQPTTIGCAPLATQLSDNTAGAVAWFWDFDDGFTSTSQSPSHTYTTPGFYTVQLTITFNGGCVQTISNFATFDVQGASAGFLVSVTPCPPYAATFTDTSHNAVSWFWTFGDGGNSTQQHPVHSYAAPGYYNVTLTVTTSNGCTHTIMMANAVYCPPFGASYTSVPNGTTYPLTVNFFANSVGATGWFWDFGDGGTSTLENPTYTYMNSGNYNVMLIITNGPCTLTYTSPPINLGSDTLSGPPIPGSSTPQPQVGCAPLTVTFTNSPPSMVAWHWDFGDGDTSNVQFHTHTFQYPGVYTVILTTYDAQGISSVLTLQNYVTASGPIANFGLLQSNNCQSSVISFIDSSFNAAHWYWNFGDNTSDTVQNPVHTYSGSLSNQIVTLTVTDSVGCSNSVSQLIVSNFIGSIISSTPEICANDSVSFNTSYLFYSSYLWNFGDGNNSSAVAPTHIYTTPGSYFVTLTVTDVFGCSQSFTSTVPVDVFEPVAAFNANGPHDGCDNLTVNFVNNSTGATNYFWDFGDGNNSNALNPIHTYNSAGSYTVTLTAYNGICSNTIVMPGYVNVHSITAQFAFNPVPPCRNTVVSFTDLTPNSVWWYWRFGDNSVSSSQNPTHIYTAFPTDSVRLTVRDSFGCTSNAVMSLDMFHADFYMFGQNGCAPLVSQFFCNTPNVTSWYWDFGDGNTSTQQNPVHTYTTSGSFTITLIATSTSGCSDTIVRPNNVIVSQPTADFTATVTSGCAPALINFSDLSQNTTTWEWDFGDGATSTLQNPSHIYNNPGVYTVLLIAHSANGCVDTIIKPNYITVLGTITNFSVSSLVGCNPFSVSFTDLSQSAVTWQWNFGDGNNSSIQNPSHTYSDTGSFTVTLITWDSAGCSSYYTLPQQVVVHPTPSASFTASTLVGCSPVSVSFTNTSTGYDYMLWDFGDGNTSTQNNPSHVYTIAGNYFVTAIASTQFGCADTFTLPQPIVVNQTPVAAFSSATPYGCPTLNTSFINQSAYMTGATFAWDFGNATTSSQTNPPASFVNPGFYTISLIVTNPNGCSDTLVQQNYIQVYDTVPPSISPILSVSVLSNTTVEITWMLNTATDLQAYVLYRLNPVTGNYNVIYTDTNVSNTSMVLTASYIDNGLNTLANTYTYKLLTIDRCNYAIPLDSLNAHTTINVSTQTMTNNIFVSWNSYGGCPVSGYHIYRSSLFSSPQLIATVSSATLTYLDTLLDCPYDYSYKIMATDLCGNNYVSYSDTAIGTPVNIYVGQQSDVIRSTVVDNESILTEWLAPVIQPGNVIQYDIYRSTDNINYSHIATVPSQQTDYMDYNVDVQHENYFYRVDVVNVCSIQAIISNDGSSILLQGEKNYNGGVDLWWTDYIGWISGVDHYIIERKDEYGNWQVVDTVPGSVTTFQDN